MWKTCCISCVIFPIIPTPHERSNFLSLCFSPEGHQPFGATGTEMKTKAKVLQKKKKEKVFFLFLKNSEKPDEKKRHVPPKQQMLWLVTQPSHIPEIGSWSLQSYTRIKELLKCFFLLNASVTFYLVYGTFRKKKTLLWFQMLLFCNIFVSPNSHELQQIEHKWQNVVTVATSWL